MLSRKWEVRAVKLYEVNEALENLLMLLEPDPETGEITADFDSVIEEINSLQMERSRILEYLAKLVLNCRSDAAAIKAEEDRLKERRQKIERKADRIMEILKRECGGENTDCGVATVRYRNTEKLDVSDSIATVEWLEKNGYDTFIRYKEPEVSKADVKKLIKSGAEIPGSVIIKEQSCSLS